MANSWMVKPDMVMVLLDPGFNRTVSLLSVNLPTLSEVAKMPGVLISSTLLTGWRKLKIFWQDSSHLDVFR
jgi:hypothetical protein